MQLCIQQTSKVHKVKNLACSLINKAFFLHMYFRNLKIATVFSPSSLCLSCIVSKSSCKSHFSPACFLSIYLGCLCEKASMRCHVVHIQVKIQAGLKCHENTHVQGVENFINNPYPWQRKQWLCGMKLGCSVYTRKAPFG